MSLDLQAHTLEISHIVTREEAGAICKRYNLKLTNDVMIDVPSIAGINQICIKSNPVKTKDGVTVRYIYTLKLQINVGRLLKLSNVSMITLSQSNVQAMIKKLDQIMSSRLNLKASNSNSKEWLLSRLDCGLDARFDIDDESIMRERISLLHDTFNPLNIRKCKYKLYKGYDAPEVKYESITINNDSYSYNIYYKLQQLIKEDGINLPQEIIAEIKNVIRIEKQLEGKGLSNSVGSPKKLLQLLDNNVITKIMNTIVSDMECIFGGGIHVSYEEAMKIIDASKWSDQEKLQMKTLYTGVDTFGYSGTLKILEQQIKVSGGNKTDIKGMQVYVQNTRMKIEALGISIASKHIKGILAIDDISTAIAIMEKKNKRRRTKCKFSKVDWVASENRYKCNPTLHNAYGNTFRTCLGAKTQEQAEMMVLYKIRDNMQQNMKVHGSDIAAQIVCIKNAIDEVSNFKTVVDRQEIHLIIENMIDQAKARIKLLTNKKTKEVINYE